MYKRQEFVELFREAARRSLDMETRLALETMDEVCQAKDDVEFYESCPGEREWWWVATDHEGVPVGFIVPSATPYHRNVGYLAVLPRHRGQGLVDDLLGEVTRIHATAGAQRITATTDMTNLPMAAAFDRAGYGVTEVRLVLQAPRRYRIGLSLRKPGLRRPALPGRVVQRTPAYSRASRPHLDTRGAGAGGRERWCRGPVDLSLIHI